MKKILSVDGGGMRGLLAAIQLVELEKRTGKKCCEIFDLISGTSIGGILASLLAVGVPAETAIKFFTEDGPMIFRRSWTSLFGLWSPRYPASTIESCLQRRFDGRTMKDCRTMLMVTAFDLARQLPVFFKSYGDTFDIELWKVARATSAAQTYFPAFQLGQQVLWDGGNVANNPAVCALADAVKFFGRDERFAILSLGCGAVPVDVNARRLINGGLVRQGLATVGFLFEADSEEVDYQLNQVLGDDYIRIQPVLTKPLALDDASPDGLTRLIVAGSRAVGDNLHLLDEFIGLA